MTEDYHGRQKTNNYFLGASDDTKVRNSRSRIFQCSSHEPKHIRACSDGEIVRNKRIEEEKRKLQKIDAITSSVTKIVEEKMLSISLGTFRIYYSC